MIQCTGQSTNRGAYEAAYGRKQRDLIAVAGFGSFD